MEKANGKPSSETIAEYSFDDNDKKQLQQQRDKVERI